MSLRELAEALGELTATARDGTHPAGRHGRRHDHDHQRRRVRRRHRHADPQPGRGRDPRASARSASMPWVRRRRDRRPRKVTQLALSFDHRVVDGELGSSSSPTSPACSRTPPPPSSGADRSREAGRGGPPGAGGPPVTFTGASRPVPVGTQTGERGGRDHGPHLARPAPHPPLPARRVVLPPHYGVVADPLRRHGPQPARAVDRRALRDVAGPVEAARPDAQGAGRHGLRRLDRLLVVRRLRLLGDAPTAASTRPSCATSRAGGTATSTPTWSARSWPTPRR